MNWISVKDKMPTKRGHYLVYLPKDEAIYTVWFHGKFSKSPICCDLGSYKDGEVSHWSELPEGPNDLA